MLANHETPITNIVTDTYDTKTYYVDISATGITFIPGQFFMVSTIVNGKEVRRAYSSATSPTEDGIVGFTIKKEPFGIFSNHSFENFVTGDVLKISGPYGKFVYNNEEQPVYLIGGGSGIVPLRSIMKYIIDKKIPVPVILLYSNKTAKDIIYREEFEKLANEHENITLYFTLTDDTWNGNTGRLTEHVLKQEIIHDNPLFYICGSPDFVRAMEDQLKALGYPEHSIKTEKY